MNPVIDKIINDYKVQGMITCLFAADGTILEEQIYGYRDVENQLPIDRDTIFGIASMSKSFTSLAIHILVNQGIIDLNASVSKYLPEFQNDAIKVKHLLTHSAGFYPQHRTTVDETLEKLQWDKADIGELCVLETFEIESAADIIEKLNSVSAYCGEPGQYLSYSNDSYGLLTEIIRRHGGQKTYAAFMQTEIFNPLGLSRTMVDFIKPSKDSNSSMLYRQVDGEMIGHQNYYDNAFTLHGGGAIKSTINDLIRYVQVYLKGETTFVASELLQTMQEPQIPFTYTSDYGYGLSIEKIGDATWIGHGGALTGVSSQMLWNHELQLGVLVLCNTSDVPVGEVAKNVIREYFGIEDTPTVISNYREEQLEKFIGIYASEEGDSVTISLQNDVLSIKLSEVEQKLTAISDKIFVIEGVFGPRYFQFYEHDGKITGIKVGGRILPKK